MACSCTLPINQSENKRVATAETIEIPASSLNQTQNERVAALFAPIEQTNAEAAAILTPSEQTEAEIERVRVEAWAARLDQTHAETRAILDSMKRKDEERLAKKVAQQVAHKEPASAPQIHTNMKQRQWTLIGGITVGALVGTIAKMLSSMSCFGLMMSSLAGILAGGFASYHLYSIIRTQN